jgi:hypothetical protein
MRKYNLIKNRIRPVYVGALISLLGIGGWGIASTIYVNELIQISERSRHQEVREIELLKYKDESHINVYSGVFLGMLGGGLIFSIGSVIVETAQYESKQKRRIR